MNRMWLLLLLMTCSACNGPARTGGPVILGGQEGEKIWVFPEYRDTLGAGGELQIYLDSERFPQVGAAFAKFTLGVGGSLPMHRHDKTEEIAYILSGSGTVVSIGADGNSVEAPIRAGYVWYNPRGVWHSVRNDGATPLALVFATIPNEKKGLMSFFRRIGTRPGQDGTPISPEALHKLGESHDLIFRDAPVHVH